MQKSAAVKAEEVVTTAFTTDYRALTELLAVRVVVGFVEIDQVCNEAVLNWRQKELSLAEVS